MESVNVDPAMQPKWGTDLSPERLEEIRRRIRNGFDEDLIGEPEARDIRMMDEMSGYIDLLTRQRDGWIETAREYATNSDYYRDERMKLLEKYEPEEYKRLSDFWDKER